MDRRAFFKYGLNRLGETVAETLEAARPSAPAFARPPYAAELPEFLELCNRCDDCLQACPHDVIFKLDDSLGAGRAGLPALDLLQRGCHLCSDWPCVQACGTGALALPDPDDESPPPLPRLARAWIDEEQCLPWRGPECGACAGSCPVDGALTWQGPRPRIDPTRCTGCALCREACITTPRAVRMLPVGSEPA